MYTVREDLQVETALEEASEKWSRAREAWEVVVWVLARDPTCGSPLAEGGQARTFVYEGSWAHDMPTIGVLYVIEYPYITIRAARFADARSTAGHA